mgnify:FL=1
MKELDPKFEKIKELMTSLDASERSLGFVMMQQLGFLSARGLIHTFDRNHSANYAPLLIAFEVPKYLSYGQHRLLSEHRFNRIKKESRCPVRTRPILTYGTYDSEFLKIIFANMHHYGQDTTVANEKGWLLTPDASEHSWNYKVGEDNGWYLAGMKNISWK